jgi:transposase
MYMARNLKTTNRFIKSALEQVKTASDVHEMRKCLSIVLVNQLRCSVEQAGTILGVSVPTVSRLRKEFQDGSSGKNSKRDDWGGRRHSFLSMEEEKKFLLPFVDKARSGELVIIASIQEAFEHRIGKEVPASTITRLLDRHRWRKLEPEPHHPDEDKVAQEAFKKKRFPRSLGRPRDFWLPPDPCE